jgi:hypothetical protein
VRRRQLSPAASQPSQALRTLQFESGTEARSEGRGDEDGGGGGGHHGGQGGGALSGESSGGRCERELTGRVEDVASNSRCLELLDSSVDVGGR